MRIITSTKFGEQYKKIPKKVKDQFKKRMELFIEYNYDPRLKNHKLTGEYSDCRSINITGDFRLVYFVIENNLVQLVAIDTHSELYI